MANLEIQTRQKNLQLLNVPFVVLDLENSALKSRIIIADITVVIQLISYLR